jgi:deoxyribodipyrimidine photo-lyase
MRMPSMQSSREHIFIFRRDLRTQDNLGWLELLARCDALGPTAGPVRPVFVLCAEQADPALNPWHSAPAVRFMMAALRDLRRSLPSLRVLRGLDELDALRRNLPSHRVASVSFNADVTPYARRRDAATLAYCREIGVPCHVNALDYLLVPMDALPHGYQVFTPYYRRAAALPVTAPATPGEDAGSLGSLRGQALRVLARIRAGEFKRYAERRDHPGDTDGTTGLSTHLKFGTISVREAYAAYAASGSPELVRQLYWRAFYDQLAWHFPRVLQGAPLRVPRNGADGADGAEPVRWRATPEQVLAWKEGRTGVPLVDAGMRQLASTGRMHNRARMVTASYLIWDLGADWREGERHFARCLEDYHPPSNAGGWQWMLQQQPSRVMSPWAQAKRFDRDGAYVARWAPDAY